jgi:hypothetical protein
MKKDDIIKVYEMYIKVYIKVKVVFSYGNKKVLYLFLESG